MTGSEQREEVEVIVCGACLDEFEVFEGCRPGIRLSCPRCGEPVTLVDIKQANSEGFDYVGAQPGLEDEALWHGEAGQAG